ncbi:MAG: hypothetical protein AB1414_16010 [bacterium]
MAISLIREEQEHFLRILPILLKKDEQFKTSLYSVLSETFVKKDDFSELKEIVKELAIAQKRTEEELKALTKSHEALTEEVRTLTKSHEALTKEVRTLAVSQKGFQKHLGTLDHTVGFRLEDESFKALPHLLKRDLGLEIIGRIKRDYIETKKGRYIEVNIFGRGRLQNKEYFILGEAKSQLQRRDVDDFIKHAEMVKEYMTEEQIRLLVTYQAHPGVQDYVKKQGIRLYFSYEF